MADKLGSILNKIVGRRRKIEIVGPLQNQLVIETHIFYQARLYKGPVAIGKIS